MTILGKVIVVFNNHPIEIISGFMIIIVFGIIVICLLRFEKPKPYGKDWIYKALKWIGLKIKGNKNKK
ncbi:MAG: hypothetical protein LBN20_06105 [Endomicrobium sp.]|jgi:hypothetical protein|nr:hypothetical protein [Endomicrobium sp.]